jgi:hypothetical protein
MMSKKGRDWLLKALFLLLVSGNLLVLSVFFGLGGASALSTVFFLLGIALLFGGLFLGINGFFSKEE